MNEEKAMPENEILRLENQSLKELNESLQEEVRAAKAALETIDEDKTGNRLDYFEKEQKKWLANAKLHKDKFNAQEQVIARLQTLLARQDQVVANEDADN